MNDKGGDGVQVVHWSCPSPSLLLTPLQTHVCGFLSVNSIFQRLESQKYVCEEFEMLERGAKQELISER